MLRLVVPAMLCASSVLMAFAWLGHIRFRARGYRVALLVSWFLVLPEYALNIAAFRWGIAFYTPSEMAAINLASGTVCVAGVARFFLGERLNPVQIAGFALMACAVALVVV